MPDVIMCHTFHVSQRGSFSRPHAMMVGSSQYSRPVILFRRFTIDLT